MKFLSYWNLDGSVTPDWEGALSSDFSQEEEDDVLLGLWWVEAFVGSEVELIDEEVELEADVDAATVVVFEDTFLFPGPYEGRREIWGEKKELFGRRETVSWDEAVDGCVLFSILSVFMVSWLIIKKVVL